MALVHLDFYWIYQGIRILLILFTVSGPLIGSVLYKVGGFGMPFWVVGATGCVVAVCLHFMIPNVNGKNANSPDATTKSLTVKDVLKVSISKITYCQAMSLSQS